MSVFFWSGNIYLGDGTTDRRESLDDGRTITGEVFSPFGGVYGSVNAVSRRGSGGPFFCLSYTDYCHFTTNISKTVSRSVTCQLELNIGTTGSF